MTPAHPPAPPPAEELIAHMISTYKSLRWLIIGVAVAFLGLLLAYREGGHDVLTRNSISAYYHDTGMLSERVPVPVRNVFVGCFLAVAAMLYSYKGLRRTESLRLNVAAAGLLVVVVCPMEWSQPAVVAQDVAMSLDRNKERVEFVANAGVPADAKARAEELDGLLGRARKQAAALIEVKAGDDAPAQDGLPHTFAGWAHYVGAFTFFICIAMVCWLNADDTLRWIADPRRRWRYKYVYLLTGIAMGLVPALATALYLGKRTSAVFWVEYAGVGVFVVYWAIKSRELSGVKLPPAHPLAAGPGDHKHMTM